jgi:predicted Rossmann fold nucleotide-binding protein DprA/Smf involved in DNA uptake
MLVQAGLDYDVVQDELEAQIERLGDDQFVTFANEALIELKERYGVTTPIEDPVQKLTNGYYRGLEVLQALDEPMTVDKLAAELELDTDEVHSRIAYLSTFDRVRRDGDTVRPVE